MNKQDLQFFANDAVQIDLYTFFISFITVAVLCLLIQIFYVKFSSTLSNRNQFSKNFIVLGVATCIVIMIVKNSLALSLGLVGALSIVRFRAAIKEPEELVYLFLVIAAGLGCGALQIKITVFGILLSLAIIYIYNFVTKRQKTYYEENLNVAVVIEKDIMDDEIKQIINKFSKSCKEVRFISMSRSEENTNLNLEVNSVKFDELVVISNKIKSDYKNSKIIIARNNDLSL